MSDGAAATTMLAASKVNQFYGGSHTLWDIDLDVPEGGCVCLMGRNGVGKTTLLKSIMGLLKPSAGRITFQNRDITKTSPDVRARAEVMQWLFWQMGGLGPMSGQNNHFSNYAVDKIQYAMDRYRNEVNRLYGVMNKRLADRPFLAGEYSIADMASYPWVVPHERQGQKIGDFPHLKRWLDTIAERPAVKKAYELVAKVNPGHGGIRTEEERAILFGQTAASIDKAAATAR